MLNHHKSAARLVTLCGQFSFWPHPRRIFHEILSPGVELTGQVCSQCFRRRFQKRRWKHFHHLYFRFVISVPSQIKPRKGSLD